MDFDVLFYLILAEDDMKYMSSCHIAVFSCIYVNSDHLRTPYLMYVIVFYYVWLVDIDSKFKKGVGVTLCLA